jgi:hypothetical protein
MNNKSLDYKSYFDRYSNTMPYISHKISWNSARKDLFLEGKKPKFGKIIGSTAVIVYHMQFILDLSVPN